MQRQLGVASVASPLCLTEQSTWKKGSACMKIRAATLPDLAAVVACADLAFATSLPHPLKLDVGVNNDLRSQILDGSVHMICSSATVLGYISLWPIADHLFVDSIAVLPKYHGQGLGTQLLAFAEHEASRLGLHSVRLFTKEKMADNHAFYRHRGYCETGRCDDDGFPRVFYSKDISHQTAVVATSDPF